MRADVNATLHHRVRAVPAIAGLIHRPSFIDWLIRELRSISVPPPAADTTFTTALSSAMGRVSMLGLPRWAPVASVRASVLLPLVMQALPLVRQWRGRAVALCESLEMVRHSNGLFPCD